MDYLVEEVLSRQPPPVRDFLLQTCILDRLSGPLCEAVTGNAESQDMLEHLDRANLFLVPLDGTRRWYRYHHLFAEVLQTHLLEGRREDVADLHRRASEWYDQAGEPAAAVRHALASGDIDRAADLAELAMRALQRDRQEATMVSWLALFPDEVVQARPVLALGFIAALMSSGQFAGVEERLRDLEQRLPPPDPMVTRGAPPPGTVVIDRAEWDRLPGALELYRSALALIRGDTAETIAHAELAIARAAEDDHLTRAGAAATAGLARWADGDLEGAHRAYSTSVEGLRRAGHISDVLGCSITLGDIRITQGRLTDAVRTYQDALRLADDDPLPVTRGIADMHVGLSGVACERNDLATAAQPPAAGAGSSATPRVCHRTPTAGASPRPGLHAARGRSSGAIELLDEAEQVYFGDFAPNVRPIAALRTRLQLAHGDLASATSWAGSARPRPPMTSSPTCTSSSTSPWRWCCWPSTAPATPEPPRTRRAGCSSGCWRRRRRVAATATCIEILVQLALAPEADGDRARATDLLRRALVLAEAAGPRPRLPRRRTSPDHRCSAAFEPDSPGRPARPRRARCRSRREHDRRTSSHLPTSPPLVDPLSERELDVLRLLDSDLGGPAIARELSVSVNTVRTHTRHIYAKLGVTNRREAVREAVRLGLLHRRDH